MLFKIVDEFKLLCYNTSKKVGISYTEDVMIIELRKKSQITLPKEIVKELNLHEGDKFEISIEDGIIKLEPVAIYSKEYILKLSEEIKVLRDDAKVEYNTFNNIDDLLKSLKNDNKE